MIRATTPTHTFRFGVDPSTLSQVLVTYTQGDEVILEKEKTDITFTSSTESGITVYYGSYTLTQAETNKFTAHKLCNIQVRSLTVSGKAIASNIIELHVSDVLNDEVLS